jgi:hypothetical protein
LFAPTVACSGLKTINGCKLAVVEAPVSYPKIFIAELLKKPDLYPRNVG